LTPQNQDLGGRRPPPPKGESGQRNQIGQQPQNDSEYHNHGLMMPHRPYAGIACPDRINADHSGMKGLMDEAFLEDLREATHRGQHDAFLEGHWVGGRPYGYRLVKITDPNRRDSYGEPERIGARLEIDSDQAAIVREIFERYSHGASPQSIAADLNERGISSPGSVWNRTKRRCTGWARSAIWSMLPNPLYSGTYYWNRTQWTKMETGRVRRLRNESDLKGTVGNAPHLAIISPETWKQVQLRLAFNKDKPKDKRLQMGGKAVYMLSGMLLCECGAHFVMDNATHYSCAAYKDGRACKNELRVRRDVAERVILKPIIDDLLAPAMVDEMGEEMRQYFAEKMNREKTETARRPAAVAELDARITRLQDRLKNGDPDMAPDEIMAIIEKVRAKREDLLSAQDDSKRNAQILHALPVAAKQYRDQIRSEKGYKATGPRLPVQGLPYGSYWGRRSPLNRQQTAATWWRTYNFTEWPC
jgi:hypothetical protein